jgi:hypothetical protein
MHIMTLPPKSGRLLDSGGSNTACPSALEQGVRVPDRILKVFEYACAFRDLDTAEDLLRAAESAIQRKINRFGGDRRREKTQLHAAREQLDRLRTERLK